MKFYLKVFFLSPLLKGADNESKRDKANPGAKPVMSEKAVVSFFCVENVRSLLFFFAFKSI
jgi:hypothetical protein